MPAESPPSATTTARDRFLAACRGETALPVPVWLMRQAGRYLEEYRAVRAQVDFLTLCKDPDLATEVTLQPLRRFDLDAAILFSDIMVPVEPMGLGLDFDPGPRVTPALRSASDIAKLRRPRGAEGLGFALEAVRKIRAALGGERALVGFAGAPATLATYLCEGAGAREFTEFKRLIHADPGAAHDLLDRLAQVVSSFLTAQLEAGCDCVQLFDTWGGLLDPYDYAEFVIPHVRDIVAEVSRTGAPFIYFCRDSAVVLPHVRELGANVCALDWRVDLGHARAVLGDLPLQGNLDPVLLCANADAAVDRARRILEAGGGRGHIFNLGHGVLKDTPPAHVGALVDAVKRWRP